MKKIKMFIVLLSFFTSLFSGRYAGDFMEIGSGIRALSMGGAYSAIADDGSGIYWNTAGIAKVRKSQVSLMRAYLYDGLATYDHLTFCQPLPANVTIGFNWTRLTIDDIPVFKESHIVGTTVDQRSTYPELHLSAIPDDTFASHDDMFQFGFSKNLSKKLNIGWLFFEIPMDYYFGGNFKYIKRDIYENIGTGIGFDFNLLLETDLSILFDYDWLGKFSTGLNFQDIGGTSITWDTESSHEDEILFNTKLGFALNQPLPFWNSNLILSYDHDYVYQGTEHFGLEYSYKKILAVRAGHYKDNFSAGLGLSLYNFTIDYGFITNVLGNTNRVGVKIKF